ncbi:tRNA-specific 2-thiouridylase MnmA [Elysia marginata]|uniref:tRNA-5-taurinomethyluridine 2-sulfurtransferase n=1 Tax=Elysia marginata TaxID=1093978 RepID=A0AAV4JTU6_9GAST|nr:tRNA-specific 2-thiouridylase MnmA [Elysia marginata]
MNRVAVGLSGGVDSSVAAYLLREQGYDVIGIFMKNWHDDAVIISNECPWVEDSNDAMLVAEKLGLPFYSVDLSKAYKEQVVNYMFAEYGKGKTPNPDVLCNREIKFDAFLKFAETLKADFVATGHYCRKGHLIKENKLIYRLLSGLDEEKDQSYFLCQISQNQIGKALFPIGHLTKKRVREIAQEQGFVTAQKKDSQGLCFVGKVKLPVFLQQQLKSKKGKIIEINKNSNLYKEYFQSQSKCESLLYHSKKICYRQEDGLCIGYHQGAHFYTVGQRRGLHIGGKIEPLYVIGTDINSNTVFVGEGKDHSGLWRKALKISPGEINWVRRDMEISEGESMQVKTRIRYRQPFQKAILTKCDGQFFVLFDKPQNAVTSGQFVAWYLGHELIGSGVID